MQAAGQRAASVVLLNVEMDNVTPAAITAIHVRM
jgi:hypothetical protein